MFAAAVLLHLGMCARPLCEARQHSARFPSPRGRVHDDVLALSWLGLGGLERRSTVADGATETRTETGALVLAIVTDSFNAQLVKIPLPADGHCHRRTPRRCCRSAALPRPEVPTSTELSPRAACSSLGRPARGISSASTLTLGSPSRSTLGDVDLPSPDGLELRGNTLYVVGGGLVTVVRLGARLASGVVLGEITDPGLDVPTTATVAAGRLRVVQCPGSHTADSSHGILDHPTAAAPRKRLIGANQYRVPWAAPCLRSARWPRFVHTPLLHARCAGLARSAHQRPPCS